MKIMFIEICQVVVFICDLEKGVMFIQDDIVICDVLVDFVLVDVIIFENYQSYVGQVLCMLLVYGVLIFGSVIDWVIDYFFNVIVLGDVVYIIQVDELSLVFGLIVLGDYVDFLLLLFGDMVGYDQICLLLGNVLVLVIGKFVWGLCW